MSDFSISRNLDRFKPKLDFDQSFASSDAATNLESTPQSQQQIGLLQQLGLYDPSKPTAEQTGFRRVSRAVQDLKHALSKPSRAQWEKDHGDDPFFNRDTLTKKWFGGDLKSPKDLSKETPVSLDEAWKSNRNLLIYLSNTHKLPLEHIAFLLEKQGGSPGNDNEMNFARNGVIAEVEESMKTPGGLAALTSKLNNEMVDDLMANQFKDQVADLSSEEKVAFKKELTETIGKNPRTYDKLAVEKNPAVLKKQANQFKGLTSDDESKTAQALKDAGDKIGEAFKNTWPKKDKPGESKKLRAEGKHIPYTYKPKTGDLKDAMATAHATRASDLAKSITDTIKPQDGDGKAGPDAGKVELSTSATEGTIREVLQGGSFYDDDSSYGRVGSSSKYA